MSPHLCHPGWRVTFRRNRICRQRRGRCTPMPCRSTLRAAIRRRASASPTSQLACARLLGIRSRRRCLRRLDGSVEYETSDGEVRRVQAGSFVLVEDTHGKGHLSRIPQRRRLSSGFHYRTASNYRPHSPSGHAVSPAIENDRLCPLLTVSESCNVAGSARRGRDGPLCVSMLTSQGSVAPTE